VKSNTPRRRRQAVPKIRDAFPGVFSRATPIVHEQQPLIFGASLLRFHPIEAALVLSQSFNDSSEGPREKFLGGYSILAGILKRRPGDSYKWLFEPCGKNAVSIRTLKSDESLGTLLDLFQETRFGFTVIKEKHLKAMVGMSDVLRLYGERRVDTKLTAKEVASPAIAVEPGTPLRTALGIMFEKRVRKLVIKGRRALVSDREIISYIFSPLKLKQTRESPGSLARTRIGDAVPVEVDEIPNNSPLHEVAAKLLAANGNTVMCGAGVVTPWDVVIKPWAAGRLEFKS